MKVRELINELSKYDGDMEVRFMDYELLKKFLTFIMISMRCLGKRGGITY